VTTAFIFSNDIRLPTSEVCCSTDSKGGSHWAGRKRQEHSGGFACWQVQTSWRYATFMCFNLLCDYQLCQPSNVDVSFLPQSCLLAL